MKRESLVDQTFNGCLVLADALDHVFANGRPAPQSFVRCFCSKEFTALNMHLKSGHTKSCGCLSAQVTAQRNFKHGDAMRGAVSVTHRKWQTMNYRCVNPKCAMWHRYGGRGIRVCERWHSSNPDGYANFLQDMGECPPGMQPDRFPNRDGNYEPGNCRWATARQQRENRDDTRVFTVRGITACLKALCRHFKISYGCVAARVKRGWEIERALFTPNRNQT